MATKMRGSWGDEAGSGSLQRSSGMYTPPPFLEAYAVILGWAQKPGAGDRLRAYLESRHV